MTKFFARLLCVLLVLQGYPLMALQESGVRAEPVVPPLVDGWAQGIDLPELLSPAWSASVWAGSSLAARLAVHAPRLIVPFLAAVPAHSGEAASEQPAAPPSPPTFLKTEIDHVALPPLAELATTSALVEIALAPGWNLISVPEEPSDTDPAAVLSAIGGAYTHAIAYNGCDPADPWKLWDPSDPASSDLTEIDSRTGLWLEASLLVDLPSAGTLPASTSFELCTGWNLIGFPAGQARPVRNALASIDGQYVRVIGYDALDAEDPWESYDVNTPDWANDLKTMQPGRGYWILVTEDVTLEIANEGPAPTVALSVPEDLDVVTSPTDVIGTVKSPILEKWALSYREIGEEEWREVASGVVSVSAGELGGFDPTVLVNGLYELRLEASDYQGRSVQDVIAVVVDGEMKIGHFVLPLLDLSVKVVGVPFEVVRIYDSKDRGPNDFGHGWRLHLSEYEVRENTSPGLGWQGTVSDTQIPAYCIEPAKPHLVIVRFPDGSLARYQPQVEPRCQLASPQQEVTLRYVPAPGTRSELAPVDIQGVNLLVVGSFPGPIELWELDTSRPHDPNTYRLTTATGAKIEIDEDAGLRKITDSNDNVMEVSPDGLIHSSGLGIEFERDSEGRITKVIDPSGKPLTYEYDAAGDLIRMIDRIGQPWRYVYSGDHFLETIIGPGGRRIAAFTFDGNERWSGYCEGERCIRYTHQLETNTERMQDADGNELVYVYDNKGNITAMTDLHGETTFYDYNEHGDLIRQINPDGGILEYEYDDRRNLIKRIDPHPAEEPAEYFTTSYTRGAGDRVTRAEFPTGAALVMTYDARGNLLRQQDESGNVLIEFTYGSGGVITSETGAFGTTVYGEHNAHGGPRVVTDPFGVTTRFTYDSNGNVLSGSDPFLTANYLYDDRGREISASFSNGVSVTSTYGLDDLPLVTESSTGERRERLLTAAGQVRGWKFHGGFQVDYAYNDVGLLATISQPPGDLRIRYEKGRVVGRTDFRGNVETFEHDSMGRIIRRTNSLDHAVERTFDEAGRVRSITNPRDKTWTLSYLPNKSIVMDPLGREEILEFDSHGLPRRLRRANGATREIDYLHGDPFADPEAYPTRITDIGGRTVRYDYNEHGNPTKFTNNASEIYLMTWNARLSRLTSVTGPLGNRRSFRYDNLGRLEEVTFGDGGILKLSRDSRGLIDAKILPSGIRFDFTYDPAFNLTGWTTSAGESASLTWNLSGLLTSTADVTGISEYSYDGTDLETIENADGSTVTYGRDILGRLTSITVTAPGYSQTTSYAYDEAGNLVSITDPLRGETTMSYDAVNRLAARVLPNGVTTTYEYNDLDQMIGIVHQAADGTVLRSVTYEREGVGEPTKITREDGSYRTLSYDDALRLVQESYFDATGSLLETLEYSYDAAGNRRTRVTASGTETYHYDTGNRLTSISGPGGVESYSHDADGRLVGIERDGEAWLLEYDGLDHLTAVVGGDGAGLASYTYDATGRRLRSGDATTAGRQIVVAPVTDPARFQSHLVRAADGSFLAGYAFAHEKPFVRVTSSGVVYYLTDAKGSVIGMVDESGEVVADFEYDGFGNVRRSDGAAAPLDRRVGGGFRFHGEWMDEATSFYFLRARTYDPRTGRFLSRDAAEISEREPETLNAYVFAKSNPHVFSDPLGLYSISEVNIVNAIQNVLGSIDVQLKRYAIDEAKSAAAEAAIDFLRYVLESQLGPLSTVIEKSVSSVISQNEQGLVFEATLSKMLCRVLFKVPAFEAVSNYLYLEVPMESDGRALNDGLFQCDKDGVKEFNKMKKRPANPDYVLAFNPPSRGSRSTILVGDFKRSASKIVDDKQFRAIVKHARNFGFWTVLYITLFRSGGPTASSNKRPTEPVVQVFVLSLFGGRGRR